MDVSIAAFICSASPIAGRNWRRRCDWCWARRKKADAKRLFEKLSFLNRYGPTDRAIHLKPDHDDQDFSVFSNSLQDDRTRLLQLGRSEEHTSELQSLMRI